MPALGPIRAAQDGHWPGLGYPHTQTLKIVFAWEPTFISELLILNEPPLNEIPDSQSPKHEPAGVWSSGHPAMEFGREAACQVSPPRCQAEVKWVKKKKAARGEPCKKKEREACVCPFMRGDVDAEPGSQQ